MRTCMRKLERTPSTLTIFAERRSNPHAKAKPDPVAATVAPYPNTFQMQM